MLRSSRSSFYPQIHLLVSFFVIALMALLSTGSSNAAEEAPAVTIEDVLAIEYIGDAKFSPDGRWLAYNLVPPYKDLTDYSYWMYAFGLSGHQLWIKDLQRDSKARLQPGLDHTATNYVFAMSPDSRYVVVLEYKRGKLRLVSCELGRDNCTRYPYELDLRDKYFASARWNERIEWTSQTTFVFPTRSDEMPGSETRNRALIGHHLWTEWNKAWDGTEPTASEVYSTGITKDDAWAEGKLVEFNVSTGDSRLLAEGRFAAPRVSPDGHGLLVAKVGERVRPRADARPDIGETHPLFDRRYAPMLISLESKRAIEIPGIYNVDPDSFTWAADGRRFAVFGWQKDQSIEEGSFQIVDAQTLEAHPVKTKGLELANSRFGPSPFAQLGPARAVLLEMELAVFARPEGGDRYDWYLLSTEGEARNLTAGLASVSGNPLSAGGEDVTVLAETGAYRIGAGRQAVKLSQDAAAEYQDLYYRSNPGHSWANEFRTTRSVYRWPLPVRGGVIVTERNSDAVKVEFLEFAAPASKPFHLDLMPGAAVIAISYEAQAAVVSVKQGAATQLILVRTGRPDTELAEINDHLNAVAAPKTQLISYELVDPESAASARRVDGCLILPPSFDATARYPLLIDVYPTDRASDCETLNSEAVITGATRDLWASRGFIYYRPAIPLDFARTQDGPIAGMDDIVEQTIDAILETGFVDDNRIVLYGISQGGVSALFVATQSKRFAAVISINGWADFFSHYFGARGLLRYFHLDQNGGDNRWRYECEMDGPSNICPFGFGESALSNPEVYVRNSPVALARGIAAPVMLVHSDLDYFDMSQYDEMFGALYRAGKEARYVRYWGEGHDMSSPANMRDLEQRISIFLKDAGVTP